MLTFNPENGTEIAVLVDDSESQTPVFWHPFKDDSRKIQVSDITEFDTPEFRDLFALSKSQMDEIIEHLKAQTTPENSLQTKFFAIKKYISDTLYHTIDLRDSPNQKLMYPIPIKPFIGHEACVGSTNSGKTFHIFKKCLANITGPKKFRRQWIWISSEWNKDRTIAVLRKKMKFQKKK